MADFKRLGTTLAYVRLGLVSFTAMVLPITAVAQELCATDLFAGEPDEARLIEATFEFFDILETNGVVAFEGSEGRLSVGGARRALEDGVASASMLSCVVNADTIEFASGTENRVIACDAAGNPSPALLAESDDEKRLLPNTGADTETASGGSGADDEANTAENTGTAATGQDSTPETTASTNAETVAGGEAVANAETTADDEEPLVAQPARAGLATGKLFCSTEVAVLTQYLSSEA